MQPLLPFLAAASLLTGQANTEDIDLISYVDAQAERTSLVAMELLHLAEL